MTPPPLPWLALLLMVTSGCSGTHIVTTTPPSEAPVVKCLGEACIADPNSHDAKLILQRHGFSALTDDEPQESSIAVDGNWIVWAEGPHGVPLYAYNTSSKEFVYIASDSEVNVVHPILSQHGKFMYYQQGRPGTAGVMVWDSHTKAVTRLNLGVEGNYDLKGWQDDWVVFANRGSPNGTEDGAWALNLKDHRRIHLFKAFPQGRAPDGTYINFIGGGVDQEVAYLAFHLSDGHYHSNMTIQKMDLRGGFNQTFRFYGMGVSRFFVDDGLGIFVGGTDVDVHGFGLLNGTKWRINGADESGCVGYSVSLAMPWVSYVCSSVKGKTQFHASLVNLQTGERRDFRDPEFAIVTTATDGRTLLVQAYKTDPQVYDHGTLFRDLYSLRIPDS